MANYLEALQNAPTLEETRSSNLTVDNLLDDNNWGTVASYMEDRADMTEDNYSREEIRDAFVNSMRGFNSGNSIDVVQEMNYLYRGEGDELANRRATASNAYTLWDSLGGAFGEGTTGGQKLDAVGDYARAIILDPVNVVSLGFGKAGAAAATRTSTAALKAMAMEAGEAAASRVTGKVAKDEARRQAVARTMRTGFSNLGEEAGRTATRRAIMGDIAAATAVDSAAAVAADAGIQSVDRTVGRQEGYDARRGVISGAMGVAGGALAGGFALTRGWGALADSDQAIEGARRTHQEMLKELRDAKKAAARINREAAQESTAQWVTPLEEYVEQGRFLVEEGDITAEAYDRNINVEFMQGLKRTLRDGGIPIEAIDTMDGQTRTAWYIDTLTDPSFPNELYDQIDDVFKRTVARAQPGVETKNLDLIEWMKVDSLDASEAGKTLAARSAAARRAKANGLDDLEADDAVAKIVKGELGEEPPKQGWWAEKVGNTQHNFIRMLVTHPATTALNVVGWANATAMTTVTDMLRGTLYGGWSVAKNLTGDAAGAAAYRRQAGHMFRLQKQKFKNLVSYEATKDEALSYLMHRPEAQKKMFRYMAGGIESKDLVDDLNRLAGEASDKTKLTKALDTLQTAYGVSAQDMLTKTQEFMYALDKGIRRKYGQTYNEFMGRDDLYDILYSGQTKGSAKSAGYTEYMEIEGRAVEEALGNVFARKLGSRDEGLLRYAADILESARNVPVIGALVPFGQFFNNSVVFMADHVGVSMILKPFVGNSKTGMELALRAAAGWTTILWAAAKEKQSLDEGLAWHEERNSDGKVVSRLYDFPVSFYKMIGRMGAHMTRDGAVPKPLYEEFLQTFGPEAVLRGIGDTAAELRDVGEKIFSGESEWDDVKTVFESSASMYASGFTRFAEPVNVALAMAEGDEYVEPTRNIGNKGMNNAIRYTDQIIDSIIGYENLPWDASGYERENYNPINNRDMGVNPGKMGGTREVAPASSTDKLFNDIGRPQWTAGLYDIRDPEAREVWEQYIFPLIEYQSDRIMESGQWDRLDLAGKERALDGMLRLARQQVRDSFAASASGDKGQAGLIVEVYSRKNQGREGYEQMLELFDVTEETLSELTVPQLQLLVDSMKSAQSAYKDRDRAIIGQ